MEEEFSAATLRRVLADTLERTIREKNLTKVEVARELNTSSRAVNRIIGIQGQDMDLRTADKVVGFLRNQGISLKLSIK